MSLDLVIHFTGFHVYDFDSVTIFIIGEQDWGPDGSAGIHYKLPYHVQGILTSLTIGITDKCIKNTLVGQLCMVKSNIIHDDSQKTATRFCWVIIDDGT